MTTWPNWIDLIIVTIILRTCYNGFGRGFLAELLSLIGALTSTSLTLNYAGVIAASLKPWIKIAPGLWRVLVFWGLFLSVTLAVRLVIRRVADVLKWEHLHWIVQGTGLVLGGLRGLWWSGFLLVVLASSGFVFLHQSVEERSMFGPRLLSISREALVRVADRFPGARDRNPPLVPPMRTLAR